MGAGLRLIGKEYMTAGYIAHQAVAQPLGSKPVKIWLNSDSALRDAVIFQEGAQAEARDGLRGIGENSNQEVEDIKKAERLDLDLPAPAWWWQGRWSFSEEHRTLQESNVFKIFRSAASLVVMLQIHAWW
jgi:hypothetical protein